MNGNYFTGGVSLNFRFPSGMTAHDGRTATIEIFATTRNSMSAFPTYFQNSSSDIFDSITLAVALVREVI
jgi:hypothetical protein